MKTIGGLVLAIVISACSDQDVVGGGRAGAGAGGTSAAGGSSAGAAGTTGGAAGAPSAGKAGRNDAGDAGASDEGGAAGSAGSVEDAGAGGEAGAAEVARPAPIWDEHSTQLELKSGDFFSGYFGYQRTRAQLSQAQLTELAQIRTAPSLHECLEDGQNIVFQVTDDGNHVATFHNDSCTSGAQVVDPDAAQHFVDELPCVLSKDPRLSALSTAPQVEIGDGCENGLFTSSSDGQHPEQAAPSWLRVHVPTAHVPVVLQLADCGDRTFALELMNETGETVLATGAPSAGICESLSYSFDSAGSYPVRVTLTGGTTAGDLTFRAN